MLLFYDDCFYLFIISIRALKLDFILCSHIEYNNVKLFIFGIRKRFDVNSILSFPRSVIELFKVETKYINGIVAKPVTFSSAFFVSKLLLCSVFVKMEMAGVLQTMFTFV